MQSILRRWWTAAVFLVAGVFALTVNVGVGRPVTGVVIGAALLIGALVVSPALFPRSPTLAEAQEQATSQQAPLIFWKPGCTYCLRLRFALGPGGNRAVWVDVWTDAAAAQELRGFNDGDETTPTVSAGGVTRTNPEPAWVRERLPGRG